MEIEGVKVGEKVCEGKTKQVYKIPDEPGQVLLVSKDRITAGDGARAHDMKGKAEISTATTCAMFELLSNSGIKTHFIRRNGTKSIKTYLCDMIPIEWVTRRVATGSFLKRNQGVKEGYRFCPPKQETFFKDDANNDPQWSYEQCVEAQITVGGVLIGPDEIDIMSKTTVTVFEILERYWASLDCSLIDMKIEFGVHPPTGEILLADVVDSDSWRLWPSGDKRLMKDKDVYRKMTEVTEEGLDLVKRNYEWVVDRLPMLTPKPRGRAVVLMGSATDMAHCEKIRTSCKAYGVPCELRVTSAHKGTMETMNILAKYEGDAVPTVFIAVAGRSNGLGPVLSGNATWPVINCPPVTADWGAEDIWSSLRLPSETRPGLVWVNATWCVINCPPVTADWGAEDIWSSLRLPSGLGCSTVMSPDGAALAASQILGLTDHVVWSKLRAKQLNTWVGLKLADKKSRNQ